MAWMPLNDHTAVKPTYDIHSTVNYDPAVAPRPTASSIGQRPPGLDGRQRAGRELPDGGSRTFNWHSAEPIAVLPGREQRRPLLASERVANAGDVLYYESQAREHRAPPARPPTRRSWTSRRTSPTSRRQFNGPFPFNANGIVVALPSASFQEEMQTKIVFVGGSIGNNAQTFSHENMHQWWGDNVSYSDHRYTFFKEGYARTAEYYFAGRNAANLVGGQGTPAGDAAFEASIVNSFNTNYLTTSTSFWNVAPANPTSANLFGTANTYTRPGIGYIALRSILGKDNYNAANKEIQRDFGGGSISPAAADRRVQEVHAEQVDRLPRTSSTRSSSSGGTRPTRARPPTATARRSRARAWPAAASMTPTAAARTTPPTSRARPARPSRRRWR